MCIHTLIFSPFRLLCPKTDRIHVSTDIVVLGNDQKSLKPFKIVVYSHIPFPETETETETETGDAVNADSDAGLDEKMADLKLDPRVYGRDRELTQQRIRDVYADFFKNPAYGYEGVIFKHIDEAPKTRKLHPCAQASLLMHYCETVSDRTYFYDPIAYEALRQQLVAHETQAQLLASSTLVTDEPETPEQIQRRRDCEEQVRQQVDKRLHPLSQPVCLAIGRYLLEQAYGTRAPLDDSWKAWVEERHKGLIGELMLQAQAMEEDARAQAADAGADADSDADADAQEPQPQIVEIEDTAPTDASVESVDSSTTTQST